MSVDSPQASGDDAEVRRVEMLYSRLPSGIVTALIGIFLCFLVLFESMGLEVLKQWAAYMLSVSAMRVWLWYMFGKADLQGTTIRRWEWLFAAGAMLTSLGWGALFGPLYPPASQPDAQMFVALMVVITAFTGSVFVAVSNVTFWLFIIPILGPAVAAYALTLGTNAQWPVTAAACCIAVFIIVQRTLYQSSTRTLRHSAEADALLAEQQAIFDSSPGGIVVLDGRRIVKSNMRMGELLGRRLQDLSGSGMDQHFVNQDEAARFLAEHGKMLESGRPVQGMFRLRRANGEQFWAEISGRHMAGKPKMSVWIITDITLLVANQQRNR